MPIAAEIDVLGEGWRDGGKGTTRARGKVSLT